MPRHVGNWEVTTFAAGNFTTGFASTMTTVGGLVSALVIAELAITKPGEVPIARAAGRRVSQASEYPAGGLGYLSVGLARLGSGRVRRWSDVASRSAQASHGSWTSVAGFGCRGRVRVLRQQSDGGRPSRWRRGCSRVRDLSRAVSKGCALLWLANTARAPPRPNLNRD
jgi:hypothetical protein